MLEHLVCLVEGPYKVCVDPTLGGHIVEFSLNGKNALHAKGPAIGSTFWPSPQSAWDWPPPAALDRGVYSSEVNGNTLVLVSQVCEQTGLQVIKTLSLEESKLQVRYTMRNASESPLSYAPWEISRVGGGVTFYEGKDPALPISTGTVSHKDGYVWHHYDVSKQKANEKVFANGSSGWLANVYDGMLLVKQFDPLPAGLSAPGEAEIEIYGHGDVKNPYIEVEQQGRFETLKPGAELSWNVTWFLAEVPKSIQGRQAEYPLLVKRIIK